MKLQLLLATKLCRKLVVAYMTFMANRTHKTGLSGDGTWWMKCGHTLEFGIVSVVSCETGEVLDFEVVSKHCSKCKLHKSKLSPKEFKEWFQEHKNSDKCQIKL